MYVPNIAEYRDRDIDREPLTAVAITVRATRPSRLTEILAVATIAALSLFAVAGPVSAQEAGSSGRATITPSIPIPPPHPDGMPAPPAGPLPEMIPSAMKHVAGAYKPWETDVEVNHDMASGRTFTAAPRLPSAIESAADSMLFSEGTAGPNRSLFPELNLPGAPKQTPSRPGAWAGGGVGHPNLVFGSDNRIRISPTNYFPASAQCHVVMMYPDGAWYQGSGTIIGYKYVLTAGHVVYSQEHGGWAKYLYVYPGQDGGNYPYGYAYATYLRSVTGWTSSEDSDYDYGLITMNRAVGYSTGWFGLASFSDSTLGSTGTAYLTGYPGEKPSGTQWQAWGPILDYDSARVYYKIDETPGDSGAGVYRFWYGSRYVFAVNTGWSWHFDWFNSGYFNHGTRINTTRFYLIEGWMATGY
jgi:V8-like Glu-specific endopeptidase